MIYKIEVNREQGGKFSLTVERESYIIKSHNYEGRELREKQDLIIATVPNADVLDSAIFSAFNFLKSDIREILPMLVENIKDI